MPKPYSNSILIVDDNVGARHSIEALLSSENYNLQLASNGKEALELAQKNPPDLVLLDVMMPGMSGFEVCEHIRKNKLISEVPVIMITALDDEESMIQGIDAGADDFLSKPINKIELRSRVRGILRLNRYRKICDERKKFELVVTYSNFGYIVLDQDSTITFSNPKAMQILNLEDSGIGTAKFVEQVKKQYTIKTKQNNTSTPEIQLPSNENPMILVSERAKLQEPKWVRVTKLEISNSGKDQLLLRLEDITQNIISFQEKHTFSRMVSHKLLTPLNALKAAEQLMERSNQSHPTNATDVSHLQKKGLARLEYDIHSILKFLDSNSNPSNCSTDSTLTNLANLTIKAANELGVEMTIKSKDITIDGLSVGISEYGYESCIREVVENAIKFHEQGSPKMECLVYYSGDRSSIHFDFLSDAKPLSEEELANAWKPYWQAERYTTGEISGMGLGLALIATNVWSIGGTCKLENRKDKEGVLLCIQIPIVSGSDTK